jgi:hypothetical protein
MKKVFLILLLAAAAIPALSQFQYEVIPDPTDGKIVKGIVPRDLFEKDSSFKWYAKNLKGYAPNAAALAGLKANKDSIQLVAFMGTWCEDSHYIIPKLFILLDSAGFSRDKLSLVAVDRNKKTIGYLTEALNVKSIPTIIVFRNGIEAGRVIEYGKTGLFDKDLGEIFSRITTK